MLDRRGRARIRCCGGSERRDSLIQDNSGAEAVVDQGKFQLYGSGGLTEVEEARTSRTVLGQDLYCLSFSRSFHQIVTCPSSSRSVASKSSPSASTGMSPVSFAAAGRDCPFIKISLAMRPVISALRPCMSVTNLRSCLISRVRANGSTWASVRSTPFSQNAGWTAGEKVALFFDASETRPGEISGTRVDSREAMSGNEEAREVKARKELFDDRMY